MITTAVPEGDSTPDVFVLDMRQVAWDGTAGVTLTAPWEGHGMAATQSHALRFEDFPAMRIAWPGQLSRLQEVAGGDNQCLFTAVTVGIVETALESARRQVARRRDSLRTYGRTEWTRAKQEGWLIQQA
jgi:alkylation response protein AidB-like acyl-CoA dehydrogenase